MAIRDLWRRQLEGTASSGSPATSTATASATVTESVPDTVLINTMSSTSTLTSVVESIVTVSPSAEVNATPTFGSATTTTAEREAVVSSTVISSPGAALATTSINLTAAILTTNFVTYTKTVTSEKSATDASTSDTRTSKGDSASNTNVMAGVGAGLAVFCILVIAALWVFTVRRRRKGWKDPTLEQQSKADTSEVCLVKKGSTVVVEKYGHMRIELSGKSAMRFEMPGKPEFTHSVFELDATDTSASTHLSEKPTEPIDSAVSLWSWKAGDTQKATYQRDKDGSTESTRDSYMASPVEADFRPASPANMLSSPTTLPPTLQQDYQTRDPSVSP